MDEDANWYEVDLGPGHIVLDGDPPSPKKGTASTQFSAHVHCGQTVRWITMKLRMQLGLSPGDIVLDGDPASPLLMVFLELKSHHSRFFFKFCSHNTNTISHAKITFAIAVLNAL